MAWSPSASCEGLLASDRAKWCVDNCGLTTEAAQQRVMSEFPTAFRSAPAAPPVAAAAVAAGGNWNGEAVCDGERAEARAQWCVQNLGLSVEAARQRVMGEHPTVFSSAPAALPVAAAAGATSGNWNGEAVCDGERAEARAQWCLQNLGQSVEAARQRVMGEYPSAFGSAPAAPPVAAAAGCGSGGWNGEAVCDGERAEARAQWCMQNLGLSVEVARQRVMGEYPQQFSGAAGWNPEAVCDGQRAEERAQWCVQNLHLAHGAAQQRVMGEYPQHFGGVAAAGGAVCALGAASQVALQLVKMPVADTRKLVWSDEFKYEGPPDPSKWRYDIGGHGWGNNELQHYTDRRENAWVSNGALRIHAVNEPFGGNEFTSARLVTKGCADWMYGRIEIRLRLPTARGSWAAAWMLPTESSFGEWPRSGEIDIMEHVGMDLGNVHGTVHTEKYNHMKNTQVGKVVPVTVTNFHTYAVEWSHDKVSFLLDDHKYHEFRKESGANWEAWPFDKPFHIILNIAVGGAWGGQKGVEHAAFRGEGQVMEVAWVRVYHLR
mmetsp:Transcript_190/g.785  ORF Transcript_190/g.785 Transcript_190/m.785 type:complete len:546 (-) Transcript_190:185-1822(-)